jgi:hypothetical protein
MFANLDEAVEFVTQNFKVTGGAQVGPFSYAEVELLYVGDGKMKKHQACGFAKYNPNDAKQGLPYSAKQGQMYAIGRAVHAIARELMEEQREYIN